MEDLEVRKVIAEQLNRKVEDITDDKELTKDLGADSLDAIEILMTLEEKFETSVPEEEIANLKTVGDIIKMVNSKK